MIRIICGTCGTSQGYKTAADGKLSLPAAEEKRLVFRGVAEYVTMPIIENDPDAPPAPPTGDEETEDEQQTAGGDPPAESVTGGEETDGDTDAEVARLEKLQRKDLEAMAADMGVDISGAKNKHDIAVLIVAAEAEDDGEAPPSLVAGDIVS